MPIKPWNLVVPVVIALASLGASQRAEALRPCYPCNVSYANCIAAGRPQSTCESEYQACVSSTCPEDFAQQPGALDKPRQAGPMSPGHQSAATRLLTR